MGVSLIAIAVLMMFMNEKRMVSLEKLVFKAREEIVQSDIDDVDRVNDDRLVQVYGMTST